MAKNKEATISDVSLRELLLIALKQWRKILCIGIIIAVIASMFYFIYDKPKKVNLLRTDISILNNSIKSSENYKKESIYYQLPEPFYQENITFMVKCYQDGKINDPLTKSLLIAYSIPFLQGDDVYSQINKSLKVPYRDDKFLRQVISISDKNYDDSYVLDIKINHYDNSIAEEIASIIMEIFKKNQIIYNNQIANHELILINQSINQITDQPILNEIKGFNDRLLNDINSLSNKQSELAKYESNKTSIGYITIAITGGIVFAYLYFCILYLFSNKVKSANQIKYNYSVEIMAEFIRNKKSKFDKLISAKVGEPINVSSEEMLNIFAINLETMKHDAKDILILSSQDADGTYDLLLSLTTKEDLKDYNIDFLVNKPNTAQTLEKILNYDAVVLVVKKFKTTLNEIEREIDVIESYGKKILGVILVD
ncbi:MAG: hypothetical protein RR012_01500 [Oscillospiraceae bacterium]